MKKVILTFTILLFAVCTSYAQLMMEKSKVRLTVEPGDTIVDSMALHNTSERPMDLTIYWEDFEYLPPFDGKKKFMPAGTSRYSMANWITYSPQEVTIPPQSKKEINFTIRVPKTAQGGHYGVLFFEQGSRRQQARTGVNIVTRMGSLFFIDTKAKDKTSVIKDVRLNKETIEGIIRNQGDVFVFPQGVYYVMDQEGLVIERGELAKIYLPPDEEAPFRLQLPDQLSAGVYTVVLTFDLDEGDSAVVEVDIRKTSAGLKLVSVRD